MFSIGARLALTGAVIGTLGAIVRAFLNYFDIGPVAVGGGLALIGRNTQVLDQQPG